MPEELTNLYRSNVSTFFWLATEAFEGTRKLTELNLQAAHAVLAESVARLQEVKPDMASADWMASPLRLTQSAADRPLVPAACP